MSNEVMVTLLTTLGVLLTTIVSVICYRNGKQTEHRKMQVDIYTTYAIKLHEARASIYPSLYELLSSLIKHIEYGSVTYTDIKTFLDQVNEWDSKHSIFFSDQAADAFYIYRQCLWELIRNVNEESKENLLPSKTVDSLRDETAALESRLKSDLAIYGIMETESGFELKVVDIINKIREGRVLIVQGMEKLGVKSLQPLPPPAYPDTSAGTQSPIRD